MPQLLALVDDEAQIGPALKALLSFKRIASSVHETAESLLALGGLGLCMTHGILSQLGGRMALDNPESGGARVRLSLPLIHAAPSWAA